MEKLIANVAPCQAASFAEALIEEFRSVGRVFSETPESLRRVIGPWPQVIELIEAAHVAMEVGLRGEVQCIPIQATDQRLIDYLVMGMGSLSVEQLRVLFLDGGNRLVGDEVLASGTLTTLTAYPRNIFRRGFELSASAILLVHNHPSGQVVPSKCDIEFTKKLKALGYQMEIEVRDHIIVSGSRWFSFLRGGLM
ncbi:MAG: DNA repair protein RadC [Sphingorhabdus sp.]|uniref:JAB domain-containing protein n=1 Tax=Sphingorhabdus sp. TaxID=1902408 RepID=UPI0025D7776C|nr:JAB domain-containing protein [Sphingorhabdus sp.]MCO4091538.1 DNA repair protein RadC [Sphingorhabdus sp.]